MVLLIFVDGVGIGPRGPQNPLDGDASAYFAYFEGEPLKAPRGGSVAVTHTTLGVDGTPQSATGQATIITGSNAAAFLGRHQSGFPGGSLRPLLGQQSLFRRLLLHGKRVAHANVATSKVARKRVRLTSAMSVAADEAGLAQRTLDDVAAGRALHHDFTNRVLVDFGYNLPVRTPVEAADVLARLASEHDFTVFEYFLTDAAGHARDAEGARDHIARVGAFLDATLDALDLDHSTVLLTSDHGNLENLDHGGHTTNPVATTIWGRNARETASTIGDLTHIAAAIERLVCDV